MDGKGYYQVDSSSRKQLEYTNHLVVFISKIANGLCELRLLENSQFLCFDFYENQNQRGKGKMIFFVLEIKSTVLVLTRNRSTFFIQNIKQ